MLLNFADLVHWRVFRGWRPSDLRWDLVSFQQSKHFDAEECTGRILKIFMLMLQVYKSAKRKCYLLITIFLSVPTALVCGVQLAVVTFLRVWCCLPCLKTLDIQMQCMHLLLHSFFRAFAVPFFESVGRCFYFLRARIYKTESRK